MVLVGMGEEAVPDLQKLDNREGVQNCDEKL